MPNAEQTELTQSQKDEQYQEEVNALVTNIVLFIAAYEKFCVYPEKDVETIRTVIKELNEKLPSYAQLVELYNSLYPKGDDGKFYLVAIGFSPQLYEAQGISTISPLKILLPKKMEDSSLDTYDGIPVMYHVSKEKIVRMLRLYIAQVWDKVKEIVMSGTKYRTSAKQTVPDEK